MVKRIALLLLLVVIFARPVFYIASHKDVFFNRNYNQKYEHLQTLYSKSQYVQKKSPELILDETFEEFAGGFFLKGNNPISIVHDHPPLGRYFISLSILLFDNARTIIILFFCLSALATFLIAKSVLGSLLLALIPTGIVIN